MKPCRVCGAPTKPSKGKKPRIYCSPKCAQRSWRAAHLGEARKYHRDYYVPQEKQPKICVECGAEFLTNSSIKKFCTPRCCFRAQDRRWKARRNSRSHHARAGAPPCEVCGSTVRIHKHHIVPGGGESPSNIAWLCVKCHTEVHRSALYRLEYKGPAGRDAFLDLLKITG